MSPLRFRKVLRLGPLAFNLGRRGLNSVSVRAGKWSWNTRSRAHRVDLPGPWSWVSKGRRR